MHAAGCGWLCLLRSTGSGVSGGPCDTSVLTWPEHGRRAAWVAAHVCADSWDQARHALGPAGWVEMGMSGLLPEALTSPGSGPQHRVWCLHPPRERPGTEDAGRLPMGPRGGRGEPARAAHTHGPRLSSESPSASLCDPGRSSTLCIDFFICERGRVGAPPSQPGPETLLRWCLWVASFPAVTLSGRVCREVPRGLP